MDNAAILNGLWKFVKNIAFRLYATRLKRWRAWYCGSAGSAGGSEGGKIGGAETAGTAGRSDEMSQRTKDNQDKKQLLSPQHSFASVSLAPCRTRGKSGSVFVQWKQDHYNIWGGGCWLRMMRRLLKRHVSGHSRPGIRVCIMNIPRSAIIIE